MPSTITDLLQQVTRLWKSQAELARKDKAEKFGDTAKRLWHFYGKRYQQLSFVVDEGGASDFPHIKTPYYKPVLNKSRQYVELYLPSIHASLTHRLVRPRRPDLPPELSMLGLDRPDVKKREQLQSWLLEWFLNYLPAEYDAFTEQRTALQEALVKGRGVLWHEIFAGPYGDMPGSFHVSVDDLLIDADARKLRDAGFIIRERWEPAYKLAEDWREDVDKLRSNGRSNMDMARAEAEGDDRDESGRRKGDLVKVLEVYSRIGIGHRLLSSSDDDDMKAFGEALDAFGPHVHLLIVDGIDYPINLKPDDVSSYTGAEQGEFLREQLKWPIAFFEEHSNPWPMTTIDPYPNCMDAWATSSLESGLPIQEYLDQAYNWIMQRVQKNCRNLTLYSSSLEAQFEEGYESGWDMEMIKVNGNPGEDLSKKVAIVSFPEITGDVWRTVAFLNEEYEKITGMTPLMYGVQSGSAMRSAEEASIRNAATNSRPQDIAKAFEEANSKVAAKEGQASRLVVDPATVAPLFSEPEPEMDADGVPDYDKWMPGQLTRAWMELVSTDDPRRAAAECHYTVESGSGMRKNKQWIQAAATNIIPLVMPIAQMEYSQGNPKKWNAIMQWVADGWEIPLSDMMQPELSPEEQMAMQQQAMAGQPQQPGMEAPPDAVQPTA